MIAWTVSQAIEAGIFEKIVVSTDSDEIAEISADAGASVFFRRSADLSSDTAAKLPVIRDAFVRSEAHFGQQYDIHVDLDATSPLRIPADIIGAVDYFLENHFDNVITGMPARRSPYFNLVEADATTNRVFVAKRSDKVLVRRQDAPLCFDMNASIYVWDRQSILTNDRVLGTNTGLFVMPEERSIDVDSELDFLFVEFVLAQRLKGLHDA